MGQQRETLFAGRHAGASPEGLQEIDARLMEIGQIYGDRLLAIQRDARHERMRQQSSDADWLGHGHQDGTQRCSRGCMTEPEGQVAATTQRCSRGCITDPEGQVGSATH